MWFIKYTKNDRLLILESFLRKFVLVFILTQKNALSWRFQFKANRKSIGSSEKRYKELSKQPSVWEIGMLLCNNSWKCFQYSNFEKTFLKSENLFKKTGEPFFFLNSKIENIAVPYKTSLPKTNFKANRMRSNEWIYHKERSFVSNYFTFLKMLFQFKNLLYRFYLLYQQTKGIYTKGLYTFHKRWSFILFYFIFVSNRISQRQKTLSKLERFFLAEKYF